MTGYEVADSFGTETVLVMIWEAEALVAAMALVGTDADIMTDDCIEDIMEDIIDEED